jgi:molybdopterin converting factor small subunit
MSVSVRIPTILRPLTGGVAEVEVDPADSTVAGVLAALDESYPGFRERILDDQGAPRRFINLYIGDQDIRACEGLETKTGQGARLSIIPAVAGG